MTLPDAPPMIWHGWGDPTRRTALSPAALTMLREQLALDDRSTPPVPIDAVQMQPSALSPGVHAELVAVVGADNVRSDRDARLWHAGGKSYPDLLRRRTGHAEDAPDAVVLPGSHEEVQRVLDICVANAIAVVPFGGGTSVVGGVEPVRGRFSTLIALDLSRLTGLTNVDRESMTATLGAGLRGPQAEALLNEQGFTL